MSNSSDFFADAYQDGPFKSVAISITILSIFIIVPSGYGIIWYEKYGVDQKKNLINRILTSACWTGIDLYLVALPFDIVRYVYGPLPETLCLFHFMHKNAISILVLLFCDFVTLSRYFYMFHISDPIEFKTEFWHTFINTWVICCGFLSSFVFAFLPGQQPVFYYLCTGQKPETSKNVKINYPVFILVILSVALQLAFAVKFIVHRIKLDSNSSFLNIDTFKKENIFDIFMCFVFIVNTAMYIFFVVSLQSIEPALINTNPYHLYLYGFFFGFPVIGSTAFSLVFYVKNKNLRETVYEAIIEMFENKREQNLVPLAT